MYDKIFKEFESKKEPLEVILVGLGFMGFGSFSLIQHLQGISVPLIISRRTNESCKYLKDHGYDAVIENELKQIQDNISKGIVSISNNLDLITDYPNKVILSTTGTIDYETKIALKTLNSKKHLVTMNVELQTTVGTELKKIADSNNVIITDALGDQPGSLSRFIGQTKLMGFRPIMAGNMKRFMNRYATPNEMKPWAESNEISLKQVTSFTDGTKQSLEMNLLANYFGMNVLEYGMKGPSVTKIQDVLEKFDWENLPNNGVVDYVIGKDMFPGIFIVGPHNDPNQKKYLNYLSLGEGPYHVIFEPYHLCHLEIATTLGGVMFNHAEIINNGLKPNTITITVAKRDLEVGELIGGIGSADVYGNIDNIDERRDFLPIGLSEGTKLKRKISKDEPISLDDVVIPSNTATKLTGLAS